jgi:predicted phage gp36 major capsid-like protein
VSDVERIAQTYSHTLRSDLIAELNRLRAALDEANTRIEMATRMHQVQFERADRIEAERDRAVAQVERVEALCARLALSRGGWDADVAAMFRAALAGEGSDDGA